MRKSLLVSYGLWFFLGPLGAHRFYLRDYGWGILYFLTGGLFGIGWFVDAFTLPRQVDRANRVWGLIDAPIAPARLLPARETRRLSKQERAAKLERDVLEAARRGDGTITVAEAALAAGVTLREADRLLTDWAKQGYADIENRASGAVCYRVLDHRS